MLKKRNVDADIPWFGRSLAERPERAVWHVSPPDWRHLLSSPPTSQQYLSSSSPPPPIGQSHPGAEWPWPWPQWPCCRAPGWPCQRGGRWGTGQNCPAALYCPHYQHSHTCGQLRRWPVYTHWASLQHPEEKYYRKIVLATYYLHITVFVYLFANAHMNLWTNQSTAFSIILFTSILNVIIFMQARG